ncbi:hypothetical protein ACRAWD_30380 [Caulobacter segnis]
MGYIDLRMFADFTFGKPDQPARQAIEAALRLVSTTDAVIIDLRDSGGGSPAMVGYLSSAFTPRARRSTTPSTTPGLGERSAAADWYAEPRLTTPLYLLIARPHRLGRRGLCLYAEERRPRRDRRPDQRRGGQSRRHGPHRRRLRCIRLERRADQPDHPCQAGKRGRPARRRGLRLKALDTARGLALETVLKIDPGDTLARWALEDLRAEAAPPAGKPLSDYVGDYGALTIGQADGRLLLRRGERPPTVLLRVSGDTSTVAGESDRRVIFERDASGAVTAMEAVYADGDGSIQARRLVAVQV